MMEEPRSVLGGRYLVVDNAPAVRAAVMAAVRTIRPNAQFVEAAAGKEALEAAARARFDAVFTGMGLADGERALPIILALLDADPRRPVFLITVMPVGHPEVVEALSHGAAGHLAKPVNVPKVREALNHLDEMDGRRRRIS